MDSVPQPRMDWVSGNIHICIVHPNMSLVQCYFKKEDQMHTLQNPKHKLNKIILKLKRNYMPKYLHVRISISTYMANVYMFSLATKLQKYNISPTL